MEPTPFSFGRIAAGVNFTDRDAERERLIANFSSLVNTVVISPRRWGKSSLVRQVAVDLPKKHPEMRVCLVDLFNVRSEADFYAQLTKSVLKATMSKWEEWVETARRFMSRLRPVMSISPEPLQEIEFELDWQAAERDPDEILDLAENIAAAKKLRIVVCIDEFQSIAAFPDAEGFQRKLRSHWQRHQQVCYCLYGSKRHMMLDIFANSEMPFYRFGDVMMLEKIDNAVWGRFIAGRFAVTGKSITVALGCELAAEVDNHSYYVQQLAQQAWFRTEKKCSPQIIADALWDLKDQLSLQFTGLVSSLTVRQLNFLKAVLAGERSLSAQATLKKYNLGTSANVTRIKDTLVNREIIDLGPDGVQILDPIFARWLRTDYFSS